MISLVLEVAWPGYIQSICKYLKYYKIHYLFGILFSKLCSTKYSQKFIQEDIFAVELKYIFKI